MIPGLAQWVKDPVWLQLWLRLQLHLRSDPWLMNSICLQVAKKKKTATSVHSSLLPTGVGKLFLLQYLLVFKKMKSWGFVGNYNVKMIEADLLWLKQKKKKKKMEPKPSPLSLVGAQYILSE